MVKLQEKESFPISRKIPCPNCESKRGVRIFYGMPSAGVFELIEREEISLGGCVVFGNDPSFQCLLCEYKWQDSPHEQVGQ